MSKLIFEVPPGIGDTLWCYQRVASLIGQHDISFKVCGDPPFRANSFVDMMPGITNLGYGRSYRICKDLCLPYDTDLSALPDGEYCMQLNSWLESGGMLGDAYPKQAIDYHPNLTTGWGHVANALATLSKCRPGRYKIGFYCSSFAHRPDLGLWLPDEWVTFLGMVSEILGRDVDFIALGASYDDRTMRVVEMMQAKGFTVHSTVGQADIGTTIELIRGLDYFFAFPSGLGILGDVVNTPTMMWYWSNRIKEHEGFPGTYADPENTLSKRHINLPYIKPHTSAMIFERHGKKHIASASAYVRTYTPK
jgi:hypothetical protein